MNFKIFLLCLTTQFHWLLADQCHKKLDNLADKQSHFILCATRHAVPIELCVSCKQEYTNIIDEYELLKENCSTIFFDKDRINIISTTQSILVGLWSKAYCEDCFSNNSKLFKNMTQAFENCATEHINNTCVKCLATYTDLNMYYKSLEHKQSGKICYDIQDKMNRTRQNWSKTLHCCHRTFKKTFFLIAIIIVGFLPVLFYSGTYTLTKRREQNHELLNADTEIEASTSSSVPVVSPETSAQQGSSHRYDEPASVSAISNKPKLFTISDNERNSDYDSDDEDDNDVNSEKLKL